MNNEDQIRELAYVLYSREDDDMRERLGSDYFWYQAIALLNKDGNEAKK